MFSAFNFLYNYFDDYMIAKTTLLFICIHAIQVKSIIFAMSIKLCNLSDKAFLNKYNHFIKKTTRVVARESCCSHHFKIIKFYFTYFSDTCTFLYLKKSKLLKPLRFWIGGGFASLAPVDLLGALL